MIETLIIEANAGVSHEEFVNGMATGTMGFKVMQGEPHRLIKGVPKLVFNGLVILYVLVPLFVIPFWAYHEQRWLLLFGIVVASLIAPQFQQLKPNSASALLLIATVVFWFTGGIHSFFTFFSLCGFWGCLFFRMAEKAQRDYAGLALIKNPELFNEAVAQNLIMIVRA